MGILGPTSPCRSVDLARRLGRVELDDVKGATSYGALGPKFCKHRCSCRLATDRPQPKSFEDLLREEMYTSNHQ